MTDNNNSKRTRDKCREARFRVDCAPTKKRSTYYTDYYMGVAIFKGGTASHEYELEKGHDLASGDDVYCIIDKIVDDDGTCIFNGRKYFDDFKECCAYVGAQVINVEYFE